MDKKQVNAVLGFLVAALIIFEIFMAIAVIYVPQSMRLKLVLIGSGAGFFTIAIMGVFVYFAPTHKRMPHEDR